MLDIIDINSSSESLREIIELKESFRTLLNKVDYGTVIIINNFPAHEIIDYLIIINIENNKAKNYYQFKHNSSNFYVDNYGVPQKLDSIVSNRV